MVEKFATGVVDTGGNFAAGVKFATGLVDTGGAPWLANISRIFEKIWNGLIGILWGWGGNWLMKKTRSKKSRDTVPLKGLLHFNKKNSGKLYNFRRLDY